MAYPAFFPLASICVGVMFLENWLPISISLCSLLVSFFSIGWQLWEKHTRLAAKDAVAYAMESAKGDELNVFVTFTLVNQSAASIALTGGILSVGHFSGPVVIDQKMILGTGPHDQGSPDVCVDKRRIVFPPFYRAASP